MKLNFKIGLNNYSQCLHHLCTTDLLTPLSFKTSKIKGIDEPHTEKSVQCKSCDLSSRIMNTYVHIHICLEQIHLYHLRAFGSVTPSVVRHQHFLFLTSRFRYRYGCCMERIYFKRPPLIISPWRIPDLCTGLFIARSYRRGMWPVKELNALLMDAAKAAAHASLLARRWRAPKHNISSAVRMFHCLVFALEAQRSSMSR